MYFILTEHPKNQGSPDFNIRKKSPSLPLTYFYEFTFLSSINASVLVTMY